MKKYIGIALAVLMIVAFSGVAMATQLTDNQTFTFTTTVEKYIECGVDQTLSIANPVIPDGGTAVPIAPPAAYTPYEIAYANCAYTLTLTGDNPAGDNLPILARQEVGGIVLQPQPRFDRLITSIGWCPRWDTGWNGVISFVSNPEGAATGTWQHNPLSFPVPHDGEIGVILYLGAALPHKTPEFGVNNTWNQSADAGTYTCTVVATYVAQ